MSDENIIAFERPFKTVRISLNMDDPQLTAEIAKADEMVSYNIDAMSIEELREHARCSIVIAHKERMKHLESIGRLKREIELVKQGGSLSLKTPNTSVSEMDREIDLKLTMGDLINIHDALSQTASEMNDKEFVDIFCTIEAIEAAIVINSQVKR